MSPTQTLTLTANPDPNPNPSPSSPLWFCRSRGLILRLDIGLSCPSTLFSHTSFCLIWSHLFLPTIAWTCGPAGLLLSSAPISVSGHLRVLLNMQPLLGFLSRLLLVKLSEKLLHCWCNHCQRGGR